MFDRGHGTDLCISEEAAARGRGRGTSRGRGNEALKQVPTRDIRRSGIASAHDAEQSTKCNTMSEGISVIPKVVDLMKIKGIRVRERAGNGIVRQRKSGIDWGRIIHH